jgi:hypothetical protein
MNYKGQVVRNRVRAMIMLGFPGYIRDAGPCDIVGCLAMSRQKKKLDLSIWPSVAVQRPDLVIESLPLSLLVIWIKLGIGIISLANQAESRL